MSILPYRRPAFLVTALSAVLALAIGCVRPPPDRTPDGRIIVDYWEKWSGFEEEAMQAVVDDFNAAQTNILVRMLKTSDIDRKMMLAAAGGNPPDVAGLWSFRANVYADKGALTPLNRMCERKGITPEKYIPVFWELCSHRGFVWALPSTPATIALHWNKKLFREAGLDPDKPPRSLAELDQMAERLTVVAVERRGKRVKVRYPNLTPAEKESRKFDILHLGFLPPETGWKDMYCYWFGGRLWDGDRRITADSPENIEALRWYQSYPRKYGLDNMLTFGSSFGNPQSPQNPFLAGQVAMVLNGVWMANFINTFTPAMEWGAAPFPAKDPVKHPVLTIVECDMLCIPKGARHPEEAFEFISYVNTQGPMEKLCLGQWKFSPLARTSRGFVQKHPNPLIGVFIEMTRSPEALYVPRLPIWDEMKAEMGVGYDQAFRGLKSPEEALGDVQTRLQWRMDRLMRRWDVIGAQRIKEWSQ